ncbi:Eukaryotic peptide chain release factor subunit 1 [Mycena venus]|uniref:Eukaryotic peptide chain release factor subunit 1 n=1 Tax=Mycena venus TaxID=2733690 RepID=A0A8H7DEI9_9AGAR|nr:Eukaryotic peptide chain release factor subunit 1 [Mycena venus]
MIQPDAAEQNIQIWKVKKLIKSLESARGAGNSMISLILPSNDQISRASAMLTQEYVTASNIKSRAGRPPVLAAITMAHQRLKHYSRVPPNGLVLFVGLIVTDQGKEKKVSFDFEPHRPINTSLYLCDNKFHTEALSELLNSDSRFGFIVMDGNGTLFGIVAGDTCDVIHKFTVDLPKEHARGGQSALQFSGLRDEKRDNYVRRVAEHAVQHFITNDEANVTGLVLAGSADFKTELSQGDMFDQRLAVKVIKVVDVSHGGENGFNEAIELAADVLANVKFVREKKLIQKYFNQISQDTGRYCFGIDDTLKALDLRAVETLIVWEDLDIRRYTLRNAVDEEIIIHANKDQEKDREKFMDESTGLEMGQSAEPRSLLEWLAERYKDFGATLEFVTNRSREGAQFVNGFGGIGGLLRYKVDFTNLGRPDDGEDEFYDSNGEVV